MRLIILLAILLLPFTVHAQQTIVVPAGGNLAAAISTARCGDKILLEPSATYSGNFNLGPKPACTGTDADYITITTSDPTSTPANLTNYPQVDAPTTTVAAARMPKVVTPNSLPAFWLNVGAKYWRLKGLNITSVIGAQTVRLIGFGEVMTGDRALYPDRIQIQQNWIHPPEEDGSPLTATNIRRSVENGIYFEGTNSLIEQNDIGAFVGRYSDGSPMTTAGILITTWADDVTIQNNYIRAWTYAFFFGGGSKGFATVTATVTNCTATSCVFSSTAGITVGKAIAVLVYKQVDSIGIEREWWGQGFVSSINGSTVTISKPWCNGNNDPGGNSCRAFTSANLRQFPADGAQARIEGLQPQNILVRRNYISKRPEWKDFLGQSGGKGYFELKACHNCTIDGNVFDHGTGSTITTRNQGGADPWNDLDGLRYTNNWSKRCNAVFTGYLQDGAQLTNRSQNVTFENNLCVGPLGEPAGWEWMVVTSNVLSGGDNVRIAHNTELVASYRNYTSYADAPMRGLVNIDNIHRGGGGACFTTGAGESGSPWSDCWPGAVNSHNVIPNMDNKNVDELRAQWPTPANTITTLAGVGFVDPNSNYRLRADSPFKGKASDGKDPGADIDAMNAAIFGNTPPPLPTPTVVPTPVPSPTVQPSPQPTVSPTPQPSPLPTPTPITGIDIQGRVIDQNDESVGGALVSGFNRSVVSREGDGYFQLDGMPVGAEVRAEKVGYTFVPVRVAQGVPEQNYFIKGQAVSQSSPTPTPVVTPTPTPVPTATPAPTPTPQPSPSPTPEPSPAPVPSPSPTPTPPQSCTIDAPAAITMTRNSSVNVTVTITAAPSQLPVVIRAIPATGQVVVSPMQRSTALSGGLLFSLRSKQNSSSVRWESACGTRTTQVVIR